MVRSNFSSNFSIKNRVEEKIYNFRTNSCMGRKASAMTNPRRHCSKILVAHILTRHIPERETRAIPRLLARSLSPRNNNGYRQAKLPKRHTQDQLPSQMGTRSSDIRLSAAEGRLATVKRRFCIQQRTHTVRKKFMAIGPKTRSKCHQPSWLREMTHFLRQEKTERLTAVPPPCR